MTPEQELLKELKKKGLNIGQAALKDVVVALLDAIPAYVAKTENKADDIVAAFCPILRDYILERIEAKSKEVEVKVEAKAKSKK
jgi:hypothetical protein